MLPSILFLSSALFWVSVPLSFAVPLDAKSPSSPLVQISNGVALHGNLSGNIESFYNIKFGQDTSGPHRFSAPKPFVYPNNTIVNASVYGAACPQQKVSLPGLPILSNVTNISEDCLTLRVDRVADTSATAKLPVMVYLFGGGFVIGQIYDQIYDPIGLLLGAAQKETSVIYVAINYRVGIFGFAASSAVQAQQSLNAGLLDQRLGLNWIKENIHYFGGDPDNVTLFGESAGGFSVGLHITSYGGTGDPLFHHAIMESGSATNVPGISGGVAANHTAGITTLANCTNANNNSTAELECLRALPLTSLLSIAIPYEFEVAPPSGIEAFIPTAGSAFLPSAPSQLLYQGLFHKNIDTIAGWNKNDGSLFATAALNFTTDQQLTSYLSAFNPTLSFASLSQILTLYPLSQFVPLATRNATAQYFRLSQIERDIQFACPAILLSQAMANYSSPTTNIYLYQLDSSLFMSALAASDEEFLGICHFSDIPYVFNLASAFGAADTELDLASRISGSWTQFAYGGNLTGLGNATVEGWQRAVERGSSSADLGIMVLGGTDPGMAFLNQTSGSDGVLVDEDLVNRCGFWNSQAVLSELAV